jgi:hypothetical protein
LPAFALTKYPENLSPIEGASIWMQSLTAYGLIEFGKMQQWQHVLNTAAACATPLELSPIEIRVLCALLEKERTTPEYYPLS